MSQYQLGPIRSWLGAGCALQSASRRVDGAVVPIQPVLGFVGQAGRERVDGSLQRNGPAIVRRLDQSWPVGQLPGQNYALGVG